MDNLEQQFHNALSSLQVANRPLVETDIIHSCLVNDNFAKITLILPESSRLRETLPAQVKETVSRIPTISRVVIEILEEAPAEEKEQQPLPKNSARTQQPKRVSYLQNYDVILAIASGKGGVGKSTIALNLAITLAKKDYQVGLFDADVYGPSQPMMAGLRQIRPEIQQNRLMPLEAHGLHMISIGNLMDEATSMVWRGPMVHQALEQLLRDTNWPGGNFLIIDLPPGTGDAQLTLSQICEITGAVIVSTPQDVALLDAHKAIHMFHKVDIPIVGIIENMSFFTCPHCGKETPIFHQHGAEVAAQKLGIPFLGAVPIELEIRIGGDEGKPLMARSDRTPAMLALQKIEKNLICSLENLD